MAKQTLEPARIATGVHADIPEAIRQLIARVPGERSWYQQHLIEGSETWSGSSLGGGARQYSGRYAESRAGLVDRINDALPDDYCVGVELVLRVDEGARRWRREMVVDGPGGPWVWLATTVGEVNKETG